MRLDFVGRAIHDVNPPAVRLPTRDTSGVVLVRVGDTAIMLFLEFVLGSIRSGIAACPECLNELIAFLVVGELLECRTLFVRDDPTDVLVQPLLVGLAQLLL